MLGVMRIEPLPAPPSDGELGSLPASQLPLGEDKSENEDQNATKLSSVPTHTQKVGMIHPPTDIRNIIHTTSQFVAKHGPDLEKRIIHNNAGNVKFSFLIVSHPYHAYYQHKLSEFRAQNQNSVEQHSSQPAVTVAADSAPVAATLGNPNPAAQFRPVRRVLDPPEAEQYTVTLPDGITGEELGVIKLTAQFVARNGKSFWTGLTSREINNPQFHFLKPTHSMFGVFTALTDAYSKVLMPSKGLTDKLSKCAADRTTVLNRCLHRLEWEKSQEQAWQKVEDEIEHERAQMAMIDWHDFDVVATIVFADDEDEELPKPKTPVEVFWSSKKSTIVGQQEVVEAGKEVAMEMDEEVQLVEEGMNAASLLEGGNGQKSEGAAMDEDDRPIRIVKNWKRPEDRTQENRDSSKLVVSPITGELIPASEMSEHIRISLVDPKYKEQKERMFAKIRETTLAHDDEISRNIVGLARTRPDIFGTTEEEVSNAVKVELEKKKDEQPMQVIWDGSTTGMPLPGPAAPPPPRHSVPLIRPLPLPPNLTLNMPHLPTNSNQYAAPNSTVDLGAFQQYAPPRSMQMPHGQQQMMINQQTMQPSPMPFPPPPSFQFTPLGYYPFTPTPLHGMPVPPPPMSGVPLPPPPPEVCPPVPDEPEPKRQKLDESALVPEEQFRAQHPGAVRVKISVPSVDEGNLKGQILEICLQSLSETVGSLKEQISAEIRLPANKQKLSGKAGFLKDNLTLAYYNVGDGESLTLSLRERGGRKR